MKFSAIWHRMVHFTVEVSDLNIGTGYHISEIVLLLHYFYKLCMCGHPNSLSKLFVFVLTELSGVSFKSTKIEPLIFHWFYFLIWLQFESCFQHIICLFLWCYWCFIIVTSLLFSLVCFSFFKENDRIHMFLFKSSSCSLIKLRLDYV